MLEFRDEKLQDIIAETKALLPTVKSDGELYSQLLFNLCLEVFYRLMEVDVTLECLKEDEEFVKAASEKAKLEFLSATSISMRVSIVPSLKEES